MEVATPQLYPRDPALEGSDPCSSRWIWCMVEASPVNSRTLRAAPFNF
jgi:hypothetical protein